VLVEKERFGARGAKLEQKGHLMGAMPVEVSANYNIYKTKLLESMRRSFYGTLEM